VDAGINLYLYGRASPITFIDPNGTFDVLAMAKDVAAPFVQAGKAFVSGAVQQAEMNAAVPDIVEIINQSVQEQLQAQADAELIERVASKEALTRFEIENLTRGPPPGEAPPGFLRGFFREMIGEGVSEGPFKGAPLDVTTGMLADIANTTVRFGENAAETAVTPGEEASDEAAGRATFNFLKLASYFVGLGEVSTAGKAVQAGTAEAVASAELAVVEVQRAGSAADSVVKGSAQALARVRGERLVELGNLNAVQQGERLSLVSHASRTSFGGQSSGQLASTLNASGVRPRTIELIGCNVGCGTFPAELARDTGAVVKAPLGAVNVLKVRGGVPGIPQVKLPNAQQYLPPGQGWRVHLPVVR